MRTTTSREPPFVKGNVAGGGPSRWKTRNLAVVPGDVAVMRNVHPCSPEGTDDARVPWRAQDALARAEGQPVVRARLLRLRARAHAALGRAEEARAAAKEAVAASEAAGAPYEHALALLVAAAVDDPGAAAAREAVARAVLDRLGVVSAPA